MGCFLNGTGKFDLPVPHSFYVLWLIAIENAGPQ
jgi:hypothetical protein